MSAKRMSYERARGRQAQGLKALVSVMWGGVEADEGGDLGEESDSASGAGVDDLRRGCRVKWWVARVEAMLLRLIRGERRVFRSVVWRMKVSFAGRARAAWVEQKLPMRTC